MSKESDLYDPFNTKTLGGEGRLDVSTYENIQDPIHLERVNRKLLELTDLIGRVTNNRSSSGPIPGQQSIVETDISQSNIYTTVFTPNIGEVWQFQAFNSRGAAGASGTITYELDFYNPNTTDRLLIIDASSSSSSDFPLIESGNFSPLYLTHPFVCRVRVEGTFTTSLVSTGFYRVR